MTSTTQTWLPTAKAAEALGLNAQTLKRYYGHPETGFLRKGKHWKPGPYPNSSKGWCIEACREELTERGFIFFGTLEKCSNQSSLHS
jgi:hypothetical protein